MLCRWELHGVLAALLLVVMPGMSLAQVEDLELGLIGEFVAEEDDEDEVTQEITVEIEKDGKTVTITQTVDGEFVGEIVEGEEATPIRAKSLEELKEKSPEGHAAFQSKPAAVAPGKDVATSTVTDVDGDRRIEVQTPGRKFVSRDQRGEDLEITIKQDLEHGARTERYEAEDLATLQKKFPKIAKEYQGHAAANGVVVQLPGGARFGGNPAAAGPRKFTGEHQGQKVVITDDQGRNIRIKITKTEDGKESTDEFEADDLPELKQQHPDIARIYEKFAGRGFQQPPQPFGLINGRVQVQIGNAAGAVPGARPADPARQVQTARKMLDSSRRLLEKLTRDGKHPDAEALKKLAEEMAEISKKMEDLETKK